MVRSKMKVQHKLRLSIRRQYQSQVERKYYGILLGYSHHYNVDNRLLCRIRNCLNVVARTRHSFNSQSAAKMVHAFISSRVVSEIFLETMIDFKKQIEWMRSKLVHQLMCNQGKLAYLIMIFNEEAHEMMGELIKLKDKKSKEFRTQIEKMISGQQELTRYLMGAYLQRCKFVYCLAFFQWRSQ